MRLAWGTAQEAAALHALLGIFPGCVVEECGLFVPAATDVARLVAAGGGGNGEGAGGEGGQDGGGGGGGGGTPPPLGASPDGLICHWLRFSAREVRAAAAALAAGRPREAAAGLLAAGLARVAVAGGDSDGGGSGGSGASGGSDCGNGAGLPASGDGAGASPCGGLGGPPVEEQLVAFIRAAAADLGGGGGGGSSSGLEGGTSSSGHEGGGGGEGGGEGGGGGGGGALFPRGLWLREVVEVKSHSPFAAKCAGARALATAALVGLPRAPARPAHADPPPTHTCARPPLQGLAARREGAGGGGVCASGVLPCRRAPRGLGAAAADAHAVRGHAQRAARQQARRRAPALGCGALDRRAALHAGRPRSARAECRAAHRPLTTRRPPRPRTPPAARPPAPPAQDAAQRAARVQGAQGR